MKTTHSSEKINSFGEINLGDQIKRSGSKKGNNHFSKHNKREFICITPSNLFYAICILIKNRKLVL
jgi:hypothetical protein